MSENGYHLMPQKMDETGSGAGLTRPMLVKALLLYLLLTLYFSVLVKLVHDWYILPDFSHGFVIPFFVCFFLFRKRHEIARTERSASWQGLFLIVLGLILLLLGDLGAELFLARISFLLVAAGMIWLLLGIRHLRLLLFPLALLLLAIPIPQVLYFQLTAPLQTLASTLATQLLPLFRVPVLQEGNIIHLPSITLEVAEACSGIRSLISLGTLAVLYSYFVEEKRVRQVLLLASIVPIAVIANALRIVGTGVLVQYRGATVALGFFHEFSGLLMFVVSLAMLLGVHAAMSFRGRI